MDPKERIREIVKDLCLGEYGQFNDKVFNEVCDCLDMLIDPYNDLPSSLE